MSTQAKPHSPSPQAIEADRNAVLNSLYEAWNREPPGPTLAAIGAAIQHLDAVAAIEQAA